MIRRVFYTVIVFIAGSAAAWAQFEDSALPVMVEDTVFIDGDQEDDSVLFEKTDAAALKFSSRRSDSALMSSLRKDPDLIYEYEKRPEKKADNNWLGDLLSKPWFKNLMWGIILLAFLAIVVAFLFRSNASIFRKRAPKEESAMEGDVLTENIFDIDYQNEIRSAVKAGKYPLAVRLHYLQTLKNLSQNELIDYRQEKTNGDYIFQLFNSAYYKDFFSLTRNYEYVWYGKFPVSQEAYQSMQTQFADFNRRLSA